MAEVFTLTDDQEAICQHLLAELISPNRANQIVRGQGGVGKTVLISEFVCRLIEAGKTVCVSAFTGKATGVIRDKIYSSLRERNIQPEKNQLVIDTLTKITKKSTVIDLTDDGQTVYSNTWKNPIAFDKDVLIIDELSMVPGHVGQWWAKTLAFVVAFGDWCQIPEVAKDIGREITAMKKDLRDDGYDYFPNYGVRLLQAQDKLELTKVLRSDNDIAFLCNDLRDFSMNKDGIKQVISGWAKKSEDIEYSLALKELETDPSWQIICYTNKLCNQINNHLAIGEGYPALIDKIILKDNLNPLKLYNGDTLLFQDFLNKIATYNSFRKRKIYACMKWQGKMPRKDSTNPIEKKFFETYVAFKGEIQLVNFRRWRTLPRILETLGRTEGHINKWMEEIVKPQEKEEDYGKRFTNIISILAETDKDAADQIVEKSEELPRLYMVDADFGYAITTHRSQGSEYPKVCYILERFDKPLLYTGVSRAKKKLKVIDLT